MDIRFYIFRYLIRIRRYDFFRILNSVYDDFIHETRGTISIRRIGNWILYLVIFHIRDIKYELKRALDFISYEIIYEIRI